CPGILRRHEERTACEQLAVPFEEDIGDRIQEWMAWADKGRQGLSRHANQLLMEGDALVARQYRCSSADQPIALPYDHGHVRDSIAPRLALTDRSAQLAEGLQEKASNEVWLQAPRLRALHSLADLQDAARIHRILC